MTNEEQTEEQKLALRDKFAMAALIGMLSSAPVCDRTSIDKQQWAKIAYDWADAMRDIKEKEARRPGHVITCNAPSGPLWAPGCSCPRVHDSSG